MQWHYGPSRSAVFGCDRKNSLLLPILHCFECSFESSCRYGLAGLIPSAGTMLFPLLSFRGPIGDGAVAAVKAMLRVDCDALWRGLHALSGRPFPRSPLMLASTMSDAESSSKVFSVVSVSCNHGMKDNECTLSRKAGELLDFIDELPEQPL